ncbi:MAG: putative DNA-binding domain-containing protein [Betaproteobacteria bacterium]|nr:MAG: putative DNA-binding domain-containing protein [Betaproteobacteria bacterium]
MTSLAELQARFQRHIVHDDQAVTSDISGPDDAYRQERLLIYYRAYRLRLIAALAVDYPVLKAFVDEQRFEELATAYIEARPSMVRNLRWFGDSMSSFLHYDPRFSDEPILAELAEFEWAQGLAFDASDAAQLGFDELASVPAEHWPQLHFVAHPSLQLVTLQWNVIAIWHAHRDNKTLPPATLQEPDGTIAVWRKDYKTYFRTLDRDEAWLWRTLAAGTAFSEACSRFATKMGMDEAGAAQRAAQLLHTWVEEGWIQGFEILSDD